MNELLNWKEDILIYENSTKKAREVFNGYYDEADLLKTFLSELKYFEDELKGNDLNLFDLKNKYDTKGELYPLKTKLSLDSTKELLKDFFETVDFELGELFSRDLETNKDNISYNIRHISKISVDGKTHKLQLTNFGDLRDLYSMVHEYTHVFDSLNGKNETRVVMSEVNACLMERVLDTYLLNLSEEDLNKYNFRKDILEEDINSRKLFNFFTKLGYVNNIVSKKEPERVEDMGSIISLIYSEEFSKLSFYEQTKMIKKMIEYTKDNNLLEIYKMLPWDLSKENQNRNEIIFCSISSIFKILEEKHDLRLSKTKRLVNVQSGNANVSLYFILSLTAFWIICLMVM